MGEIAGAILDGVFCQICGEYIGEEVGYPRTCEGCQSTSNDETVIPPRRILQRCLHEKTSLRKKPFRGGFHVGRYCNDCKAWIKWERQTPAILKELQEREE